MQPKISLILSLSIIGILGIIFSLIIIFSSVPALSGQTFYPKSVSLIDGHASQNPPNGLVESVQNIAPAEQTSSPITLFSSAGQMSHLAVQAPSFAGEMNSGLPVRLKIPKINVDAALERVGITPDGAMAVPKGPIDAAWFDLGPRPGDKGTAVINGHEGWKDGIAAVFDNLYKLEVGDKLYVEDEQGTIITFVVRAFRTYGQNEDASDVFGSSPLAGQAGDGESHLNLITCAGVWNAVEKSYSNRLVVFADKETK